LKLAWTQVICRALRLTEARSAVRVCDPLQAWTADRLKLDWTQVNGALLRLTAARAIPTPIPCHIEAFRFGAVVQTTGDHLSLCGFSWRRTLY